jgi:pimeloyl-ACP methyl ester carboxylesterase
MILRVRQAWWWLLDYVYVVTWQVRGSLSRAQPGDYTDGTLAPVLILPGIYETWQFMRPLIDELHDRGHPVHVVSALRRNSRPVASSAQLVAAYLDSQHLDVVTIVAHSKGGLIGKYLMTLPGMERRITGMVAVSTPFSGSRYARFLVIPSLRAFARNDPGLLALAKEQRVNSRILSVFGKFDPHIPEGSVLPGARNLQVDVGGHFRVLGFAPTTEAVVDFVAGHTTG